MKNKVSKIINKLKAIYQLENDMQVTSECLMEATKDNKHLNLDKLAEFGESSDRKEQFKFVKDIAGIVNNINHETHGIDGYEPICGWEA